VVACGAPGAAGAPGTAGASATAGAGATAGAATVVVMVDADTSVTGADVVANGEIS